MAFFVKKNSPQPQPKIQSHECNHKFQDFPWYLEIDTKINYYQSDNCLSYKVIEPYVCIYCGERKNIILEQKTLKGYSREYMKEIIQQLNKQYADRIKPRAIIEDMINDLQLVDVNYLKYYHLLQGTKDPSTSRPHNDNDNKTLTI